MQTDWQLAPQHSGAFIRLDKLLGKLQGFHALIVQHNNPAYRDGLIQQLQSTHLNGAVLDLKQTDNFPAFEALFASLAVQSSCLHVINLESLTAERQQEFFRGINYHREYLARQLHGTLLLWLVEPHVRMMALDAADFWAWREQVLDFALPLETIPRWEANYQNTTNLDSEAKQRRIQEILDYLATQQAAEPSLSLADMQHELGNLYWHLGEYATAQQHLALALATYSLLDEKHAYARVMMDQAYIRFQQGEPDKALDDLQTKVLPWFEKLGDLKQQAEAQSRIADILQARGQLDEALTIRENHQLPVYEKLGDVRKKAVTMGQIADILQARGQLDEALQTLNETLPVYEKLGDVRLKAVTMGNIAYILQARGQLDEALQTLNETLPVYEKLGDVRAKAVTMGQIADILQARGQLDEALTIRENHQLPVYEKLGDVRKKAVTMGQIADILQARGQLDEALQTLNETLPVYEKLGDVRSKAVTMVKIADILWSKNAAGNFTEVQRLLNEALAIFTAMRLPVGTQLVQDRLAYYRFNR